VRGGRAYGLLACAWLAGANAEQPQMTLPPSDQWEEVKDPAPPADATHGRFFVSKKNPSIRLRVGTAKNLKLNYSDAFVIGVSEKMGARARAEGREFRVTQASVFELEGAAVAKLRIADGPNQSLLFWLPGESGDVVLSLMGVEGAWDDKAEAEVSKAVNAAKHLRRPELSMDEWAVDAAVIAGAIAAVIGIIVLLVVRRRRPAAA
jgi:hypothetical protein